MKAPSPLLGFNNNVRHRGRVFHIQTEDSGIRHPHIITHLFADGGRILKTVKTSYAEHLGQERLAETVRAMMQDQHKAMFIALRDGQYDQLIEDPGARASRPSVERAAVPGPASSASSPAAAPAAPVPVVQLQAQPPAPPPPPVEPTPVVAPVQVAPVEREPPPVEQEPPRVLLEPVEPPVVEAPPPPPPPLPRSPTARPSLLVTPSERIDTTGPSSHRRSGRPTLDVDPSAIHRPGSGAIASAWDTGRTSEPDLDLDALERAAAEAQTPVFQQIQNLPPPPAAVLAAGKRGVGGYSSRTPPPPPVARRVLTPGGRPAIPSPSRYAPSRPASIFATTRPPDGASIFGEDLISEKSLDEVILSYLAEDLDPNEKK